MQIDLTGLKASVDRQTAFVQSLRQKIDDLTAQVANGIDDPAAVQAAINDLAQQLDAISAPPAPPAEPAT